MSIGEYQPEDRLTPEQEHARGWHDGEHHLACDECRKALVASMHDAARGYRPAPKQCADGECDFDADEGYHCLNCGKDGSEEMMARAEAEADSREDR